MVVVRAEQPIAEMIVMRADHEDLRGALGGLRGRRARQIADHVRGAIARAIDERLFEAVAIARRREPDAAKLLGMPIQATEQYPKGLGPTTAAVAELIPERPAKTTFHCCATVITDRSSATRRSRSPRMPLR